MYLKIQNPKVPQVYDFLSVSELFMMIEQKKIFIYLPEHTYMWKMGSGNYLELIYPECISSQMILSRMLLSRMS